MSIYHKYQNDWIFDTAASSYMTSNLGSFETFLVNTRTIEVASDTFLEYIGKYLCLVYISKKKGRLDAHAKCPDAGLRPKRLMHQVLS